MSLLMTLCCLGTVSGQQLYKASSLSINTSSKELAPAFFQGGLVFCSDRKNEWFISITDQNNNLLTNLYYAEQKKPGSFGNVTLFSKDITTPLFEGPATFSRDGKTVYFTRNIENSFRLSNRQGRDTTFGIFSASLVNGQWTNISAFRYNSTSYNTGYPSLSPDGRHLFFCSDSPEGSGGFDLYVSELENGRWTQPVNLGPEVNSSENEVFPFMHENGRLYFASRGHGQTRDLDIYYTEQVNGVWKEPVHLPEPFNSRYDDYGLIFTPEMDSGYFVTDRRGSDDIWLAVTTIPVFTSCPGQQENDYCYIFYESNNTEVDTSLFAYEWDLGDGTLVRSLRAEHCYAAADTYNVALNVIDKVTGEIYFSQARHRLVVEKIEQPYITAPDSVHAGETIRFSSLESHFTDFEPEHGYWEFGDGDRAAEFETSHVYTRPGVYDVVLGLTGKIEDPASPVRKECVTRKITVLSRVR